MPNLDRARAQRGKLAGRSQRKRKRRKGLSSWFAMLKQALRDDEAERAPPDLDEDQILKWADAFFARTGDWPIARSGAIPEAPGETWLLIEAALVFGRRGLPPGGGTLPRLLTRHRGRYNPKDQNFTIPQILEWADAWHAQTGDWPTHASGAIPGGGGINWLGVDRALCKGRGGLSGGSTLARLLVERRGVRMSSHAPPLEPSQILGWADAFFAREGRWPSEDSGPIRESPDDTWNSVQAALVTGGRGLPGGSSLPRFLAEHRGKKLRPPSPEFTTTQVLAWADAWHARTGRWPTATSGEIPDTGGMHWHTVADFFIRGRGSHPGGSSLFRFLVKERGVLRHPPLTPEQILAWADAHRDRTGKWPTSESGQIVDAPQETWLAVNSALSIGGRGLAGRRSLAQFLAEHRGARHPQAPPALALPQVLAWAEAFFARHGRWPHRKDSSIPESPGETWYAVERALQTGTRGLPCHSSLFVFFKEHRGHSRRRPTGVTPPQILAWADAWHARTGRWPSSLSGEIPESGGVNWRILDDILRRGRGPFPGGSSLARFLVENRGMVRHPPLSIEQILGWAESHRSRTGSWPTATSGPVFEAPSENWGAINAALENGSRDLLGGSSLARLRSARAGSPGRLPSARMARDHRNAPRTQRRHPEQTTLSTAVRPHSMIAAWRHRSNALGAATRGSACEG